MTVVFPKKSAKPATAVTKREEKERERLQELNPQVTKAQKMLCYVILIVWHSHCTVVMSPS